MKRIYVFWMALCMLCMSSVKVNASNDLRSKVIGKWEVTVIHASGASRNSFFLDIRESDNKLVFDIPTMDIIEMRFVEKGGKLSANLYIGDFLKFVMWEENGVIKGSFEMSMPYGLSLDFKKLE